MADPFAALLKDWRARRRFSQLDLAGEAEVSARHVARLETGKARPSRDMALRLAAALDMPLTARNALLAAAGFAPAYGARPLEEAEMAPLRAAVAWMLERHAPWPAFAMDRHWRLARLNAPAERLFAPLGLGLGASLIEAMTQDGPLWEMIENKAEIARHLAARLRLESLHAGGDAALEEAARRLGARAGEASDRPAMGAPLPPLAPTRLRLGAARLSLFSTIASFGAAEDIALADLRIELMFPADEETRALLEALAERK